ncbi:TetR/AcrR family transcriptional regulator [Catenuloplanes japonicus]|uniref:TetR/AcrR family transcriptional regulator n=1 Tax=Catenuloplanes japonicus TaxID=33876 RepID=UPI00052725EC|nr:TetR/AcrR family transcriptional regulator [Catenuloplanes japonicus]
MTTPLRQRRRATAVREILDEARAQIAEHGPAGLALRSVARSLGMTVQALYHYFPSRDDLITALITEAYRDLADAIETALSTGDTGLPRFVVAAEGFRAWAIAHAARFQLIYGTPLLHYRAPEDGDTTAGARRLASVFIRELFDGFTPDQLARADVPPLSPELRTHLAGFPPHALNGLPPEGIALFVTAWGQVHGLVVLETFGHTDFLGPQRDELFRGSIRHLLADTHRRIPA